MVLSAAHLLIPPNTRNLTTMLIRSIYGWKVGRLRGTQHQLTFNAACDAEAEGRTIDIGWVQLLFMLSTEQQ